MKEYNSKNTRSSKGLSILYISVMVFCSIVLLVLVILSAYKLKENKELKAKEAAIVEKYKDLAKENENIKDEDYARIYLEGENLYIPSKDIIIEYRP